ncbi:MAG TPA: hypothetical protein VKB19_05525 [Pedobacter sp.]|nr:hypothetical protein [Pedobacter sp.]
MKYEKFTEHDALADLLKKEMMDVPSAEFSDKLLHASITSYRVSYSKAYQKEERLGKTIIIILIFFNLMMLYLLSPVVINPSWLLMALPFVIGLGILVQMNIRIAKRMLLKRNL